MNENAGNAVGSAKEVQSDCGLKYLDLPVNSLPLNFAYVPIQKYNNLNTPSDALMAGTYFKMLSMPWVNVKEG